MHSIKELYKIGNGPSSSHTMGPKLIIEEFLKRNSYMDYIKVILYGSLALTGKGHLTDQIISKSLGDIKHEIVFDYETKVEHPNTIIIYGFIGTKLINMMTAYSIGGGAIKIEGDLERKSNNIYPIKKMDEIKKYCENNSLTLYEYVNILEGNELDLYLNKIHLKMMESINSGLIKDGLLPGNLMIERKAKKLYNSIINEENNSDSEKIKLMAYAYAVCEESACGELVVTAPTLGSSGVLPSLIKHFKDKYSLDDKTILNGLKTAGLIGNLVKFNASISGAVLGCQAEVGVACAMGAAFYAQILNLTIDQIEASAEIALEHHLGLTCDPVMGYVQIPCIERNAAAALRSIDAVFMAKNLSFAKPKIGLDTVIETMLLTGEEMNRNYKETSFGGLAVKYKGG